MSEISFPVPKSIALEDMIGLTVTEIGETEGGELIIEFSGAYRILIPKGTIVKWERRRGN